MEYRSPFSIFDPEELDFDEPTEESLRKARKRLIAEFEIAGKTTIELLGKEYDRSQVLQLLENFKQVKGLRYHWIIFKDKGLLHFLERGGLPTVRPERVAEYRKDPDFLAFISPYVARRFDDVFLRLAKHKSYKGMYEALGLPLPIAEGDRHQCFDRTRNYFLSILMDIKNLQRRPGREVPSNKQVLVYTNRDWISTVNALPPELDEVKGNLALALTNLAVDLFNRPWGRRELGFQLMRSAVKIKADGATRETVLECWQSMKTAHETSSSSGGNPWRYVPLAVLTVIVLWMYGTGLFDTRSRSPEDYDWIRQARERQKLQNEWIQENPIIDSIWKSDASDAEKRLLAHKALIDQLTPVNPNDTEDTEQEEEAGASPTTAAQSKSGSDRWREIPDVSPVEKHRLLMNTLATYAKAMSLDGWDYPPLTLSSKHNLSRRPPSGQAIYDDFLGAPEEAYDQTEMWVVNRTPEDAIIVITLGDGPHLANAYLRSGDSIQMPASRRSDHLFSAYLGRKYNPAVLFDAHRIDPNDASKHTFHREIIMQLCGAFTDHTTVPTMAANGPLTAVFNLSDMKAVVPISNLTQDSADPVPEMVRINAHRVTLLGSDGNQQLQLDTY